MKVKVEPEAVEDLKDLNKDQQNYIEQCLVELEENPTDHEDSGLIRVRGRQVFKFVMKEDADGFDFRAVYDIDDDTVRVYAVFHRDEGYNKEEINGRM